MSFGAPPARHRGEGAGKARRTAQQPRRSAIEVAAPAAVATAVVTGWSATDQPARNQKLREELLDPQ